MGDHPDPRWLATTALFEGVSEELLAELADEFEAREYDAGQVLLARDQRGYVFFVLGQGRAHAEADGEVLEILEPGAAFGEIAFFHPEGLRTATIVAETPLRVWAMFGTSFREMQLRLPQVAERLETLARERASRTHAE